MIDIKSIVYEKNGTWLLKINIDDYYRNNASSLGEEPVKNR